jgi:hypothetical protein
MRIVSARVWLILHAVFSLSEASASTSDGELVGKPTNSDARKRAAKKHGSKSGSRSSKASSDSDSEDEGTKKKTRPAKSNKRRVKNGKKRHAPTLAAYAGYEKEAMETIGHYGGVIGEGAKMELNSKHNHFRIGWEDQSIGDDCMDEYIGFENHEVMKPNWFIEGLEELDYKVCKAPEEAYTYLEFYKLNGHSLRTLPTDSKRMRLECKFTVKETGRQFITARESLHSKSKFKRFIKSGNMRSRIAFNKRDADAEVRECLSMLQNFITLQNWFVEKFETETNSNGEALRVPEITSSDVRIAVQSQADPAHENTSEGGLGAGYIVLIVIGVIAVLVGGYLAFRHLKSSSAAKKGDRRRRSASRGRRDKEYQTEGQNNGHEDDQRTVAQVRTGRPVPI